MRVNTGNGGDYEPAPEGTFVGQCVTAEEGEKKKYQSEEMVPCVKAWWRLFGTQDSKGNPCEVRASYTPSFNEKATLRKVVEACRLPLPDLAGDSVDWDPAALLGAQCLITIKHSPRAEGGVWANITNYTALPTVMPTAQPTLDGRQQAQALAGQQAAPAPATVPAAANPAMDPFAGQARPAG